MSGAFDLTKPSHLLEKLDHEMAQFGAAPNNSYAAINALRDAYHLREWVWHDRLEHDSALQTKIMGVAGPECDWNAWVNKRSENFPIVRAICNGSKHFEPGDKVKGYLDPGWSGGMKLSDGLKMDDAGFYVQTDTGDTIAVPDLATDVQSFWKDLFQKFPQLN